MKENECEQLFLPPIWFLNLFPIKSKGEVGDAISHFVNEWCIALCPKNTKSKEEVHSD